MTRRTLVRRHQLFERKFLPLFASNKGSDFDISSYDATKTFR